MDSPATAYSASIVGTWDPGSVIALTPDTLPDAQNALNAMTRSILGVEDNEIEFYIIASDYPGGPVYRARWRVEITAAGPTMRINNTSPHDSELTLSVSLYPHTEKQQVYADPEMPPMRYQGVLSPGVCAILLRHFWNTQTRQMTISGYGTGEFSADHLRFQDTFDWRTIQVPFGDDWDAYACYAIIESPLNPPALWLVTTEDTPSSWQVSFCVADGASGLEDRWDEHQDAPAFVPLDWPEPEPPWDWG